LYREKQLALAERKLSQTSQEAQWKQKMAERRLEMSEQRYQRLEARRAQIEVDRARRRREQLAGQRLKNLQTWTQATAHEQRLEALREHAAHSLLAGLGWGEASGRATEANNQTAGPSDPHKVRERYSKRNAFCDSEFSVEDTTDGDSAGRPAA
jgi:hypothetical protein